MTLACAYDAASPLDAAVIANVLQQAGIEAQVFGAALSGGMGELPAQGLVRVMVDTRHLDDAREIVTQWQQQTVDSEALEAAFAEDMANTRQQPDEPIEERTPRHWQDGVFFLLLMLTGALIARLLID